MGTTEIHVIPLAICDMYLINRIENIYTRLYWLDTDGPDGPLPPMVQLVPIEKDVDPLIVFVKCTSLRALGIIPHVSRLGTGGFHRPIGTNDIIGLNVLWNRYCSGCTAHEKHPCDACCSNLTLKVPMVQLVWVFLTNCIRTCLRHTSPEPQLLNKAYHQERCLIQNLLIFYTDLG